MNYASENKIPVFWIGGGLLAYLSLGPVALAGVGVMYWGRYCKGVCRQNGWQDTLPTVTPPALPAVPTVGPQTRLNAVDVPAVDIAPPELPSSPPATPAITVNSAPQIHNHIPAQGQSDRPIPTTASPAQSERRTEAPDLSQYPDVKERMQVLLKAMAESGFPVGRLTKAPFVWCHGRSQSGKTTIAMMVSIIRMAMGHQVHYASTDDDYEPLAWAEVAQGPMAYLDAVRSVTAHICGAGKGKLAGQTFVFDEMLAAHTQHGAELCELLTAILMKGPKTRGSVIGISQADTSTAHGLSGIDAAWREERVSVQAIHDEDEMGERSPTGRYLVSSGSSTEEWSVPEWMLTELNRYGSPCPVVWVMQHFPELVRENAAPSVLGNAPAWASNPLTTDSTVEAEGQTTETPMPALFSAAPVVSTESAVSAEQQLDQWFIEYLQRKGTEGALVGDMLASRPKILKGFDAKSVREHLEGMADRELILLEGKRFYFV